MKLPATKPANGRSAPPRYTNGHDVTNGRVGDHLPRYRPIPSPATVSQPVQLIKANTPDKGLGSGHLNVPGLLLHGEVLGRLNQIRPNLSTLFLVLLRYANFGKGDITATNVTLASEVGIARKTVPGYMRLLQDGDPATGLPSLLLKKGSHRYRFKQEGLYALTALANKCVAQEVLRRSKKSQSCSDRGKLARGIPKRRGFGVSR